MEAKNEKLGGRNHWNTFFIRLISQHCQSY
nr:MAG TPA: hypothetical protein [Caudoviricetes sp.]